MHILVNMNVGVTSEADPQAADNMANNSVPRWDGSTTQLITGTIFDNGNVGIGTTTLGPGISLEVNGNTRIHKSCYIAHGLGIGTVSPGRKLEVKDGGIFVNNPTGSKPDLELFNMVGDNQDVHQRLHIGNLNWYSMGLDRSDGGKFKINRGPNIGDNNDFTIDTGGNIGIGTTSPGTTLQIAGAHPGTRPILSLKNTNAGTTFTGTIRWIDGNGNNGWEIANNNLVGTGYLEFNEGSANRMIIIPGGNVGIGTPSPHPGYKLDVNGYANVRSSLDVQAWARIFGGLGIKTGLPLYPLDVFGNARVTGTIYIGGYEFITSDDRIKFNQQRLDYGLDQIMELQPKRFDRAEWEIDQETDKLIVHSEETHNDIGLVAQDVISVIPEAVHMPNDDSTEPWSISYNTLVPVLIKAIQEQQAQIESLKQRIETLENK